MTFTLRPFEAPADYTTCVKFINLLVTEPYAPADWQAEDEAGPADLHLFRLVAIAPDGAVAGFAECMRFSWDKPGDYPLLVLVDPAYRGQGLGALLLARLEEHALAQRATAFSASVRDNEPEAIAWVKRRGYLQYRHTFESALALSEFDPAPFAGVIPAVEASGIRFTTLMERSEPDFLRSVWALDCTSSRDVPGQESGPPTYEAWERWYLKHAEARLDGIIVALDGERLAGVTALRPEGSNGNWYTLYTGVDRAYRGRQIALALKLKSIELVRASGAPSMRTNNDSQNQPMLAVNRRLGYQPEPGYLRFRKALQ